MARCPEIAILGLAVVCGAMAHVAWAEDAVQRATPPRDYSGHVQMHNVSLATPAPGAEKGDSAKVPNRGPASSADSIFPSGDIQPITPQAPPRRPLPLTDKDRKAVPWWEAPDSQDALKEDARPSGWGWLADDVFRAKARKTAAEAEQAEQDAEDEDSYTPSENDRKSDKDRRYGSSRTNDYRSGATADPDSRSIRLGEQRPAIDSVVGDSPREDRWTLGPSLWREAEESDAGQDAGSGNLLSIPSAALLRGPDLSSTPGALSAAPQVDASAAAAPKVPANVDHSMLFTPVSQGLGPVGSDESLWGGSDLGTSLGSFPRSSLQDSATPSPASTPTVSLPSSSLDTPSLGGMGTEDDHATPRALPW